MGQGELLDKDAYSRLSNSRLLSLRKAAADAGERHSSLPRQNTGGSGALCLGATPVPSRENLYYYLRHRFFAAEINLGRNVELLVFFYHANDLCGIEMSNPGFGKSQITEIEISVLFVAIGAEHRFG